MASVKLEHIYKVYPNGTKAVSDFTMDIKDGEFIVFVGPSGCGKSTTLRMIAGLEDITTGELYIDNRIVNNVEPKDRDIAMVFQNYALYPHMTIYENMAFGLKIRHVKNEIIHQKVLWAAEILGLKDYLDRKPKAMSGGQRQRVALGRAILRDPKVMLLDEPLSNLDAKLRTQMRSEIAKLHQQLKTTFIYVTHDQTEAMTLGTRVVVMKLGKVQQIDTPKNLYNYPCNKFVAGFIGTPQMNFFQGTLLRVKDKVNIKFSWSNAEINVPYSDMLKVRPSYLDGKHKVYIGIRCENISVAKDDDVENTVKVKVSHFEELGAESLVYGDINMDGDGFAETSTRIIMRVNDIGNIQIGQIINAKLDMSKAHFFDIDTEESILPRVPYENAFDCEINDHVLKFLGYEIQLPSTIEVNDSKEAILTLSTRAIKIDENGALEAEVTNIETIGDTKLCYLHAFDRTFFAIVDDYYEIGSKVKFNIDFTMLNINELVDGHEVNVLKPLGDTDTFVGKFFNYKTLMANNPQPSFKAEHDQRLVEIQAKIQGKKSVLELEKKQELAQYTEDVVAQKYKEAVDNLATLQQSLAPQIADVKSNAKAELSTLKQKYKEKQKEIKANNKKEYAERVANENKTYSEIMKNNKDKLTLRRRKEEHRIFKETLPAQKERDLNNALNSASVDYETATSQVKNRLNRQILESKNAVKSAKEQIEFYKDPVKSIEKKYRRKFAEIAKEEKNAGRLADLLFFFNINKFFIESNDTISNKLVQGLGTSVFSRSFVFQIPHDAYEIAEEGIEVKVIGQLDFGSAKYLKCSYSDYNGELQNVYIKTDKVLEEGSVIHIKPDITRSTITEPSMNIRLY